MRRYRIDRHNGREWIVVGFAKSRHEAEAEIESERVRVPAKYRIRKLDKHPHR